MKKLFVLMALLAMVAAAGCSTNKEAIQKGYLGFDKKGAIVEGASILILGPSMANPEAGSRWNLSLMKKNYPECFPIDDQSQYGPLMCVQRTVGEEGSWR